MNNELLKLLSSKEYKRIYTYAKVSRSCIFCGTKVNNFSDSYTKLEYDISALCENCQLRLLNTPVYNQPAQQVSLSQ